jgi:hypothetical protein
VKARSVAQVLNAIKCKNLQLYKGEGYWYFEYDDGDKVFDTHSVMTMYLSSMTVQQWVEEGTAFVKRMEG